METIPKEGFDGNTLRDKGPTAVLFHATWCGFCRDFIEDYVQWATHVGKDAPFAITYADVSEEESDARWDDFGIHVVPTLIAFNDGREVWRKDGVLGAGIDPEELLTCESILRGASAGPPPSEPSSDPR